MVRLRRLELPRVLPHSDLNAARLPIPPQPHVKESCQSLYNYDKNILNATDYICRITLMIEWKFSKNLVDYLVAEEFMAERVNQIVSHEKSELIWILEHNNVYTLGTSSNKTDILIPSKVPTLKTKRGGQITYHGPGQKVVYLLVDLRNKERDVRKFVWLLEEWIIKVLDEIGITGFRLNGLVGVWVEDRKTKNEDGSFHHKIASIGLRIRKWVTYHGLSININPNLEYFDNIVPCGVRNKGVTSIEKIVGNIRSKEIDRLLKKKYTEVFI